MAQRLGSVIVFKEGVTEGEAVHAIATIKEFIDMDIRVGENDWAKLNNMVQDFDPEWGFPVWYIP